MKESELHSAIGSLPRNLKPPRDLWPGIEARLEAVESDIDAPRKMRFWQWPAMAAAVLLALATGIFIGRGLELGPAADTAQFAQHYALTGTVEAAEREYQAAFRELVPLEYSGLRLQGEDPDALRKSWEDLLQAESSLLLALQQYPSNVYLNEKLLDLRAQQLQFVKQLAMLEQNDWRRT
jgi:hypothetical protein